MDGLKLLAISGWTQPTDSLVNIAPDAHHLEYAHTKRIDAAHTALPQRHYDAVIGWSLGGILARRMLIEKQINTRALILISTPFQFVRDDRMPHAMPPDVFENFYANYRDDTHRTTQRFHGLVAKGDKHHKRILDDLEHHPEVLNSDLWLPWMDELKIYSAADDDYTQLPPTLMIHGEQDAIIRYEQAVALHRAIPCAQFMSLPDCGHAPHLHNENMVRDAIENFIREHVA